MKNSSVTDVDRLYSKIAKFYDVFLWIFAYKLAVYYFIWFIPFERNAKLKILDAGCGTGLYTFTFLRRFPNAVLYSFDVNNRMTEIMQNAVQRKSLNNRVYIFTGDVNKPLPLQYEQFDIIITGGVLEYVDISLAVKNLAPYLKSGGYFLNSVVKDNLFSRLVGRLYKFKPHSRAENINAFTSNGFVLRRIRGFPIIKEAHLFKKL